MVIGCVEVKFIGKNLDKKIKSKQFAKYRALSDSNLVTDSLQ